MCWSERRYWDFDEHEGRPAPAPEPVRAEARASDADRQRVIDQLRVHTVDGRLTLDEFGTRVGEAWSATTYADLQAVLRELPVVDEAPAVRRRPRVAVGVPTPVVIAALVVACSMLLGFFAWFVIPICIVFGRQRRHFSPSI